MTEPGRRSRTSVALDVAVAVAVIAAVIVALAVLEPRVARWWWAVALAAGVAMSVELLADLRRVRRSGPSHGADPSRSTAAVSFPAPSSLVGAAVGEGARTDVFWRPKSSHRSEEHEDGWAFDDARGIAALADGASSAFMSREWARLLAEAYVRQPPHHQPDDVARWVEACTADWNALSAEVTSSDAWWAVDSQRRGSFAAFLGVQLDVADGIRRWNALAVGDTCLVHLRPTAGGVVRIRAFPMDDADGFDNHPDLIGTCVAPDGPSPSTPPAIRTAHGDVAAGDVLLLLTDAVAEWALRRERVGRPVWPALAVRLPGFEEAIDAERTAGAMVDDDVTVLRMCVG